MALYNVFSISHIDINKMYARLRTYINQSWRLCSIYRKYCKHKLCYSYRTSVFSNSIEYTQLISLSWISEVEHLVYILRKILLAGFLLILNRDRKLLIRLTFHSTFHSSASTFATDSSDSLRRWLNYLSFLICNLSVSDITSRIPLHSWL